jgi:hypothetical protein
LDNRIPLSFADHNNRTKTTTRTRPFSCPLPRTQKKEKKEKPRMTTDDPLPTPPSSSASGAATASGSQTTDSVAAAAPTATGEQTTPEAQQQQQQQQQQQAPPSPAEAIEAVLQQILASDNEAALAGTLLNSLGSSDTRESTLSSLTSAGADPLEPLEAARHTVGSLFIMYVLVFSLLLSTLFPPALPGVASLLCWNAVCADNIDLLFMDVFIACTFFFCFFGSFT